jgi:hypothetical protein
MHSASASQYIPAGVCAQASGRTPSMPLSPPVKSTSWNDTAQTICANARVSIAKYTPDNRTTNHPKAQATTPAINGAAINPAAIGIPSRVAIMAAP